MTPRLHAFLLADHVYQDAGSGKYVLAGTFHQVNVEETPCTLGRSVGVFIALSGIDGSATLRVEFVECRTGETLMASGSMEIDCDDPHLPVEIGLEMPPLPIPRPGRFVLRLSADGETVGEAPVAVLSRSPAAVELRT